MTHERKQLLAALRAPFKARRPDETFTVTVSPVFYVYGCTEKADLESRGCFGFHLYDRCQNCRVESRGWEFWGENGHLQGSTPDRAGLIHWIAWKAEQQWKMKSGGIMGYRFRVGGPIHYQGN